jgi:hypothetical protein
MVAYCSIASLEKNHAVHTQQVMHYTNCTSSKCVKGVLVKSKSTSLLDRGASTGDRVHTLQKKPKANKNLVVSRKNPAGSLRMLHFNCTNRKIAELFQRREDKGRDFQQTIQSFSFYFFKLYLTMT